MVSGAPELAATHLLKEVGERLNDAAHDVDPFTAKRFLRELEEAKRTATRDLMGRIFAAIGACHARLDEMPMALAAFKNAALYDPPSAFNENNLAATLIALGRDREALEHIRKAWQVPGLEGRMRVILHTNEASILSKLGENGRARAAFEAAIAEVCSDDPEINMRLARSAAALGYNHDATEFFSRYLLSVTQGGPRNSGEPAAEVIRARPEEAGTALAQMPLLRAAVEVVLAEWDAPTPEEHEIRTHFTLDTDGWAKFSELAQLTPET